MTDDEQQAATRAIWREAMVELGEEPDKLISDRATAQDECPAARHEPGRSVW